MTVTVARKRNDGTHVEGALARYISEAPKYKRTTTPKPAFTEEIAYQINLYLEENKLPYFLSLKIPDYCRIVVISE